MTIYIIYSTSFKNDYKMIIFKIFLTVNLVLYTLFLKPIKLSTRYIIASLYKKHISAE